METSSSPGRFRTVGPIAVAVVVMAALGAGGVRGFNRAMSGSPRGSNVAQPKLAALGMVGSIPGASSGALANTPVSVALARRDDKLEREAAEKRRSVDKQQAIEATVLPDFNVWNGSSPLPGSVVADLNSMPMLADESAPVVALTFDDGPSEFTADVVSILEAEEVPATFFFIGDNVRNRPDDARLVADAGFAVASHTMDHPDLRQLGPAAAEAQLADSTALINDLLGQDTVQCARAPYGAFTENTLWAAKKHGLGLVNWNVDTWDWDVRDSGRIRTLATVPGQRRIILMHDGGGPRGATVDALPGMIADFKAQGARFIQLCGDTSAPTTTPSG